MLTGVFCANKQTRLRNTTIDVWESTSMYAFARTYNPVVRGMVNQMAESWQQPGINVEIGICLLILALYILFLQMCLQILLEFQHHLHVAFCCAQITERLLIHNIRR